MPTKRDILGLTFTRLFVFADAPSYRSPKGKPIRCSWVRCTCGTELIAHNQTLLAGLTRSCGCLRTERMRAPRKHGHGRRLGRSCVYNSWAAMMQRCTDSNHKNFATYSQLGLFWAWREFSAFLAYMGPGKKGWTIERVDNKVGYFPENMVWATRTRQARNTSVSRIVTFRGITAHYKDLCELFGYSSGLVKRRLQDGWPVDIAFTAPPRYWGEAHQVSIA